MQEGERIGIVGPNGAGKTTLLKMLAEELPCDAGRITLAGDVKVGYLHQSSEFSSEKTLREEVAALFTHLYEMEEELKDLAAGFQTGNETIMHDAVVVCREAFKEHWGQKVLAVMRALHAISDTSY